VKKISVITPNIGVAYSGMGPDSRLLVRRARKQAQACTHCACHGVSVYLYFPQSGVPRGKFLCGLAGLLQGVQGTHSCSTTVQGDCSSDAGIHT
jgi:hypothetical protein